MSFHEIDNHSKQYLYKSHDVVIILEENNDPMRSLKVKEIVYRNNNYNNNNNNQLCEKTKYIQYDENSINKYVSPIPITQLVENFNVGEMIPVTMINDGLIFGDINSAVEYAQKKHEEKLIRNLKKRENKKELNRLVHIEQQKASEEFQKKILNYFVICPILILLFSIYFVFFAFPYILICIAVNSWKYSFRYATRTFINDVTQIIKNIWMRYFINCTKN